MMQNGGRYTVAYHALSNTVSVHMGSTGKIKMGQQNGYNFHNNDPIKRSEHNKNIDPELTKYNINYIFNGEGNLDNRNISDTQKFEEGFARRLSKRKKKDSLGRKLKLNGKNIARETIWYPPLNIFEHANNIQQRQQILKKWIDNMLPFWQETFGADNIIEISAHLDEVKNVEGRPHIHMLTMNIVDKSHEWESTKSVKRKDGTKHKVMSKHSEGDIFEDTWFGGKSKLKKIKDNYRIHNISCGYDVKLEDMSEEERCSTGAVFSTENLAQFQAMPDKSNEILSEREELNADIDKANEDIAKVNSYFRKRKEQFKKKETELIEQETALKQREITLKENESNFPLIVQKAVTEQTREREQELKAIADAYKQAIKILQPYTNRLGDEKSPALRFIEQIGQMKHYKSWLKNGSPEIEQKMQQADEIISRTMRKYLSDQIQQETILERYR